MFLKCTIVLYKVPRENKQQIIIVTKDDVNCKIEKKLIGRKANFNASQAVVLS